MDEPSRRPGDTPAVAGHPGGEPTAPHAAAADEALASIYRRRASLLARPPAAVTVETDRVRVVLFQLRDEIYGMPVARLKRVFADPTVTSVPGADDRWAGVFPVQGEIVPILSLARVLDLPSGEPDGASYVLTLHTAGRGLGLLVGKVLEVRELRADSLRPAGHQARYLEGVSPDNALILDIDLLIEQEFSQ